MKIIITLLLSVLFLSSCASKSVTFHSADIVNEGIRYDLGSKDGIAVGDTIVAYKKVLIYGAKRSAQLREKLGSLKVVKVEHDYSIMNKTSEFELDSQVTLVKE